MALRRPTAEYLKWMLGILEGAFSSTSAVSCLPPWCAFVLQNAQCSCSYYTVSVCQRTMHYWRHLFRVDLWFIIAVACLWVIYKPASFVLGRHCHCRQCYCLKSSALPCCISPENGPFSSTSTNVEVWWWWYEMLIRLPAKLKTHRFLEFPYGVGAGEKTHWQIWSVKHPQERKYPGLYFKLGARNVPLEYQRKTKPARPWWLLPLGPGGNISGSLFMVPQSKTKNLRSRFVV